MKKVNVGYLQNQKKKLKTLDSYCREFEHILSRYNRLKSDLSEIYGESDDLEIIKTLKKEIVELQESIDLSERLLEEKNLDRKNRELSEAIAEAEKYGLMIRNTPIVNFGITEERHYRILAIRKVSEKESLVLVWNNGSSGYTPLGGSEYGNSFLKIFRLDHVDDDFLRNCNGLSDFPELLRGGRLSRSRLDSVRKSLDKFFPNFQPIIPPRGKVVIYPPASVLRRTSQDK